MLVRVSSLIIKIQPMGKRTSLNFPQLCSRCKKLKIWIATRTLFYICHTISEQFLQCGECSILLKVYFVCSDFYHHDAYRPHECHKPRFPRRTLLRGTFLLQERFKEIVIHQDRPLSLSFIGSSSSSAHMFIIVAFTSGWASAWAL